LNHADRRAQADAARGAGEGPDEFQEQVEVLGQERIQPHEGLAVGIALEQRRSAEAGVRDGGLSVFFEQGLEPGPAVFGLCQQPAVDDLTNVAGVEMDGDRETVAQFVQLRRVVRRLLDDLAERRLPGRRDPYLALAELLDAPRKAVEVENQLTARGYVLTGLVDQK